MVIEDSTHQEDSGVRRITLPLTPEVREELRAGDRLLLSGRIITARDQAHRRILEALENSEDLPMPLHGEVILYAGPSPAPPGKRVGSVGPTTASRMDPYTPVLAAVGVAAFIGKGPRSPQVYSSLREHGALYLVAVGGAAALLGSKVSSIEVIAYPELGPEAVHKLEVEEFPVIVASDLQGGDIFKQLQ
jgi:fumarate hydratase subunit beta